MLLLYGGVTTAAHAPTWKGRTNRLSMRTFDEKVFPLFWAKKKIGSIPMWKMNRWEMTDQHRSNGNPTPWPSALGLVIMAATIVVLSADAASGETTPDPRNLWRSLLYGRKNQRPQLKVCYCRSDSLKFRYYNFKRMSVTYPYCLCRCFISLERQLDILCMESPISNLTNCIS